jgi:hypothetical protein
LSGVEPARAVAGHVASLGGLPAFKLADSVLVAAVALFLVGAPAHVYYSEFSVVNVASILTLSVLLYHLPRIRLSLTGWISVAIFLFYISCAVIGVLHSFNEENTRVLRGVVVSAASVSMVSVLNSRRGLKFVDQALALALIIATAVCLLQISFVFFGVGLNPAINDQFIQSDSLGGLQVGLRSFFTNPNDLSVFGALCLLYFAISQPRMWVFGVLLSCALVVVSGSRSAMVVGLIAVLLVSLARVSRLVILVFIAIVIVVPQGVFTPAENWYFVARVRDLIQVTNDGITSDGSISLRFESFMFFISHYGLFLVPSFDASLPFAAYGGANFDASLVSRSAHNYLIELHGLFGAAGLVIFLGFAALSLYRLSVRCGCLVGFMVFSAICVLSVVPSSLVNFHQFFFIVAAMCQFRSKLESGGRDR